MGRTSFSFLILILIFSGSALSTPSTTPVQERLTLQQVLDRTKGAAGGNAWDNVRTMQIRWEAEEGGLKGTVEETDNLFAVRYVDASDFVVRSGAFGFNGKMVWSQDSSGLAQVEEGSDAREGTINEAFRRSLAFWYPERWRAQMEYQGQSQEDGSVFLVLSIKPEGGRPFELWFDSKTYLLARIVEMTATGPLKVFFTDYREIDKRQIAFHVRVKLSAGNENTYRARKIDFNPQVADSRFNIPGPPPADFHFLRQAGSVTLPMQLINNHIYIDGWLNGEGPFKFVVDTGWGTSSMTPEVANRLGLNASGAQKTVGVGEGTAETKFTKVARLRFGGVELRNQTLLVTSAFDGKTRDAVSNFGGLIGYELFKRFVVRIDFVRNTLSLTLPSRFNPARERTTLPFKLSNTIPLVHAEIDGLAGDFIIDSGFPGSVILYGTFIAKNDLMNRFKPRFETITGWGIGGPVRSGVVRARAFKLGEETVPDLVLTLSLLTKGSLADPYLAGAIGSELLRRFTVTFDYSRREVHLERNAHFAEREIFDRSGMYLTKGASWFDVVDVIKGGPADEAGIKPGDRIVSIDGKRIVSNDGKSARTLTLPEVRRKLRGSVNTRINLLIQRGESTHRAVLVLRDLI